MLTWARLGRRCWRWGPARTGAAGQDNSDPAVAAEFLTAQITSAGRSGAAGDVLTSQDTDDDGNSDQPVAWYGDSAYGTGDLRDAIGKAGHQG